MFTTGTCTFAGESVVTTSGMFTSIGGAMVSSSAQM